jgi:hypothetical protein
LIALIFSEASRSIEPVAGEMMSTISRRVSNASSGDCPIPSVIIPRADYGGYQRQNHGGPMQQGSLMMHGMGGMPRHHHQQHQMNMEGMMMNEYSMNGRYESNAIDFGPAAMSSRPGETLSMGAGMDQLMDFPTQMYMPPLRRPQPRSVPRQNSMNHHPTMQQHIPSYLCGNDTDTFAHKVPVHDSERYRTMVRTSNTNSDDVTTKSSAMVSSGINGKRKSRRPSTTSFPTKLYKILAEPKYQEYIAWLPHGRAWRVLKPKALEDDIIPKYFRSDRLASFMRQVNGWGFKRITEGPDLNAYYHEMFLRGLPHVCNKMRRPVRGESGLSRDLGQHPDFYKISIFAPLPPINKQDDQEYESTAESNPASTKVDFERSPGVVSRDDSASLKNRLTAGDDVVDDDKPLDIDGKVDCISDNDDHANDSGALITSASLDSPPGSPTTDRSISRNPSTSFFDNYGTLERTSSGHSLSSWNDQHDPDMMWSSGQSLGSPTTGGQEKWHHTESFITATSNKGLGHVTPPDGSLRPGVAAMHLIPRRDQHLLPFDSTDIYDEGIDESGLSAADLCYLTQQNRILLKHSNGRQDATK